MGKIKAIAQRPRRPLIRMKPLKLGRKRKSKPKHRKDKNPVLSTLIQQPIPIIEREIRNKDGFCVLIRKEASYEKV